MALKVDKIVEELDLRAADLSQRQLIIIMNKAAKVLQARIRTRHLGASHTETDRLARNTGKLEEKVIARAAKVGPDGVGVIVDLNTKYASLHFGVRGHFTIIRPVVKKALTVPLPGVIGPNKRALFAANSRSITGKYAANGVLHGKLPGDGKPRRLFSLRQSVAVPVRISIKLDLEDWIQPQIVQMINEKVQQVFDK